MRIPINKKSAEGLFSLPICVIMETNEQGGMRYAFDKQWII
jgi:hypothetical protein